MNIMKAIPAHKASIIRSATTQLSRAVRGTAQVLKLINDVYEYFNENDLASLYPMKLVDPATGQRVIEREVEGGGTEYVLEDGTPFDGEPEIVVDTEAIMPYSDRGLTVGEYIEMGDFIASLSYYAFGNCLVDKQGNVIDENLTAFGRPPLSHAQMKHVRMKNNF